MLKYVVQDSAYLFMLYITYHLAMDKRRSAGDVLFLIGIILIPIGKLFVIPVAGLVSVKAGFVFTTIVSSMTMLLMFIRGTERYAFIPFLIMLPVLTSILFLYEPSQSIFVTAAANSASAGSPLLRVISVFFTCIYCSYVMVYVANTEHGKRDVAAYYAAGTLFAVAIGGIITYGLFTNELSHDDVMRVSVEEIHIAGRFYRFNPGASVNEFGEIAAYAVFMLRWTGWSMKKKVTAGIFLLCAIFMSLTRGAWLGLVAGFMAYALFTTTKQRNRIYMGIAGVLLAAAVMVAVSPELQGLLTSRLALTGTPGGDERLTTADSVFTALNSSPMRMLFGYGWTADIFSVNYGFEKIGYIHGVPLMFLFDTGLVGVFICCLIFYVLGRFVYTHANEDRDIIAGMIVGMFAMSAVEHIFFHVQTWLVFGLILGIALRNYRKNKARISRPLEWQPAQ